MAFVLFPNEIKRESRPKVSISKTGIISFTTGAVKDFGLKNYQYALLYYDPDEEKIAITLSKKAIAASMPVSNLRTCTVIASKKFFKYFEIFPSESISCEIERGEKEGNLILDLKKSFNTRQSKQTIDI